MRDLEYFEDRLEQYDDAEYIVDGLRSYEAPIIKKAGEYPYFCNEAAIHIEVLQEDFVYALEYIAKLEKKLKKLKKK